MDTRVRSGASNNERLRHTGWTERLVIPALGPCWEWNGGKDRRGYGRISVIGRLMRAAHRVAYETWVGPVPEGLEVCHRCDNPPCIRPAHLFPGTRQENAMDSYTKGRTAHGERNGRARLTSDQVVAMREEYARGQVTMEGLARQHGISRLTVSAIVKGKRWARAGGPISTRDERADGARKRWSPSPPQDTDG